MTAGFYSALAKPDFLEFYFFIVELFWEFIYREKLDCYLAGLILLIRPDFLELDRDELLTLSLILSIFIES